MLPEPCVVSGVTSSRSLPVFDVRTKSIEDTDAFERFTCIDSFVEIS